MALRENDLQDTILKKISFDEFLPKTGDEKDVSVIGFYVMEEGPGRDLYSFLNTSIIDIRDVEVSPNPDEDGYYMVFVELDRDGSLLENVRAVVKEIERVSGKLKWIVTTPYGLDPVPLAEAESVVQQDSKTYMPAEVFRDYLEGQDAESMSLEDDVNNDAEILEFFKNSNLLDLDISESILSMSDARHATKLKIVSFGHGPEVLNNLGLSESAISQEFDKNAFIKLKGMLGEMSALPIDNYIIIYDAKTSNVLVTEKC